MALVLNEKQTKSLTLPVRTHEPDVVAMVERRRRYNTVAEIRPGSVAESAGFQIGDRILTVNGQAVSDIVDWKFHTAGEEATVRFERGDQTIEVTLVKGYDENLGLTFADDLFDGLHICKNKCVFCFLYQQPKGLRPSLYIKDDDFRLSFLHGNYVTLTNLKPGELDRICEQRLSPMYVSIHATDPDVRGNILGRRGPEPILPILERLVEAGIQIHGQVVLCPGYNDGPHLEETISDLSRMHPAARETYGGVVSLAVVPIGITKFRERLAPVTTIQAPQAAEILDYLEARREEFRRTLGTRFVFPSDEFYLNTKREVPPKSHYEGFPQLEDGVGLVRLFLDDLAKVSRNLPKAVSSPRSFTLVTGEVAEPLLRRFAETMNRVSGLAVNVLSVRNRFFEGNINIAGLIVGRDLVDAIRGFDSPGDTILIPSVMLRDGENVFLDEMTLEEVNREVGRPVVAVERTPEAAASWMLRSLSISA
jgi:putative radical SAM enzyme (TIGR03279 family)